MQQHLRDLHCTEGMIVSFDECKLHLDSNEFNLMHGYALRGERLVGKRVRPRSGLAVEILAAMSVDGVFLWQSSRYLTCAFLGTLFLKCENLWCFSSVKT